MILTGAALMLCVLSIFYGFRIRQSIATGEIEQFRIEVLNGTGRVGLAAKAAEALRKANIDVLEVDNADNFHYKESIVIARRKDHDADVLAKKLGCDNVIEQLVEDSIVDATLILGADYETLNLDLRSDSRLYE